MLLTTYLETYFIHITDISPQHAFAMAYNVHGQYLSSPWMTADLTSEEGKRLQVELKEGASTRITKYENYTCKNNVVLFKLCNN